MEYEWYKEACMCVVNYYDDEVRENVFLLYIVRVDFRQFSKFVYSVWFVEQ